MADHLRKQIRDAVLMAINGLATTGTRVEVGRTRPLAEDHDPTLLVYTPSETSKRELMGRPPIIGRPMTLVIEGRVQSTQPPDDVLDTIALEVEPAMAQDTRLGGLVLDVELTSTEINVQAPGTKHIGAIRMSYLVRYQTAQGVPDTAA